MQSFTAHQKIWEFFGRLEKADVKLRPTSNTKPRLITHSYHLQIKSDNDKKETVLAADEKKEIVEFVQSVIDGHTGPVEYGHVAFVPRENRLIVHHRTDVHSHITKALRTAGLLQQAGFGRGGFFNVPAATK